MIGGYLAIGVIAAILCEAHPVLILLLAISACTASGGR